MESMDDKYCFDNYTLRRGGFRGINVGYSVTLLALILANPVMTNDYTDRGGNRMSP